MWVGNASALVHAIVSVWPSFRHVCEYTACVRNIEIGQISVDACARNQILYATHANSWVLCGTSFS